MSMLDLARCYYPTATGLPKVGEGAIIAAAAAFYYD